nr:hypothetical protein [Tanacetum cinerariifolium]
VERRGRLGLLPQSHASPKTATPMVQENKTIDGQQGIQLSPATNVNIATAFSGMSYQTVDWGCQLLFQITREPHVEGTKRREAIDC